MAKRKRFKSKALEFAYDRYLGPDPKLAGAFEEELAAAVLRSKRINKVRNQDVTPHPVPLPTGEGENN